jgi:hypothetical protein
LMALGRESIISVYSQTNACLLSFRQSLSRNDSIFRKFWIPAAAGMTEKPDFMDRL